MTWAPTGKADLPVFRTSGSTAYTFRPDGQLLTQTNHIVTGPFGNDTYVTSYGYNAQGVRTSMIFPNGYTIGYTYDSYGRLSGINISSNQTYAVAVSLSSRVGFKKTITDNVDIELGTGIVANSLPADTDAMTIYDKIYFKPGAYDSGTGAGLALLAHELMHTVQYRMGMTVTGYLAYGSFTGY